MVGLPLIFFPRLAPDLTDSAGTQILYAGILGGIGGGVGAIFYAITKKKGLIPRLLGLLGIIAIIAVTLYAMSVSDKNKAIAVQDATLLEQEWITQQIGHIEFDAPERLVEQSGDFGQEYSSHYEKVTYYGDGNADRATLFIETVLKQDTHSIDNLFFGSLNGILEKSKVEPSDVKLKVIYADTEELSVAFKYKKGIDSLGGFGYMFLNGTAMESLWLIPKEKGFSDEYVEEFEFGIFPDTY